MKRVFTHILVLLLSGICAGGAWADVLALESGESLSGRLVRISDGTVVFRTSLQGQMMAATENVAALSTSENLVVTLDDDEILYGSFRNRDGAPYFQPLDGGEAYPLDLERVVEATPIPRGTGTTEVDSAQWGVRGALGLQARTGTQDALSPVARLNFSRRGAGPELRGGLAFEPMHSEFLEWMRGDALLMGGGDAAWYPYAGLEMERDTDRALEFRTGLSLGLGRVIGGLEEETRRGRLEGLLGVQALHETWDSRHLPRQGPWHAPWDARARESMLNLQLGLRYTRLLAWGTSLEHVSMFYPRLTPFGEWRASTETALTVPMRARLRLRLNLLIEHESDPPFHRIEPWSGTLGASVQLDF